MNDRVEWVMKWGDKPPTVEFEEHHALAELLDAEVCFVNAYWWKDEWPDDARKVIAVCVNCNDVFAWGCSDAEDLPYHQIENLYRMWVADKRWGADKWCAIQRNQKPQPPVIDAMKKDGAWDSMMEALGDNFQDAEVQSYFAALAAAQRDKKLAADAALPQTNI